MESLDQSFLNKSWADIVDEDEFELPIPTLDQPESQHLDDSKTNATETSPEDKKHTSNSLPNSNNASPKGKLIKKLANFDAEKHPHTNPWFTLTEEEKAEQTAIWEAESAERSKLPGASASRWAPGNAGKYSSSSTSTSTTTSFPRKPTLSSSPPASPPNKVGTAASKWATADNAPSAPKYSNKRYGDSYDRHNSKHNYSDRSNYTSSSSSRYNRNGGFDNKENFTRENRLRDYYQLTNEALEGQKSPENAQSGVTSSADTNEPVEEVVPVAEEVAIVAEVVSAAEVVSVVVEEEKKDVSVEEDVVAAETNKVEVIPRDTNDGNDLLLGKQTACATNSSWANDNDGVLDPTTTTSDNADVSAVSSGPVVSESAVSGSVSAAMTSTDGWDTTTATNNTWDAANDWDTSNNWEATTTTTTVASPAPAAATPPPAAFISSPGDWTAFALANQRQLDEKKSVAVVEKPVAIEQKKSFVNKEPVVLKDEKTVASEPIVAWKEEKNAVAGWGQSVVEPVVEKKEEKPAAKTFVWGPLVEEKPVVVKPVVEKPETEELAVGWGNPTEEKKPAVVKKPAEVSISLVDLCGGPKKPKEVFLRLSELVNTKPPREISLKLSDL